MSIRNIILFSVVSLLLLAGMFAFAKARRADSRFVTFKVALRHQSIKMFWKDEKGNPFKSLGNLKDQLAAKNEQLLFAMNGGMFKTGNIPVGLYIENSRTLTALDTAARTGNFYLKPNGVFYVASNGTAAICATEKFVDNGTVKYATQSGPMLVIDGQIHPAFKQGSANVNIRNGVGILPNGDVVYVMSKDKINFYDFAGYFKQLGCINALYLDGFVSQTYLPAKNWVQTGGDFGVIIGCTNK